jgi:hypothetical protein
MSYYAVLLKKLSDFVTPEAAQNHGDPTTLSQACDEGRRAVLNGWWKKTDEQTSLVIYYEKAEPLSPLLLVKNWIGKPDVEAWEMEDGGFWSPHVSM